MIDQSNDGSPETGLTGPAGLIREKKMKYAEIEKFCSKEFDRISIQVPILVGDWLYATDGHIAIRAQGVDLPPGFGKTPPNGMSAWPEPSQSVLDGLGRFFKEEGWAYKPVQFWPEQEPKVACLACDQTGHFVCENCDHENECPGCWGDGHNQKDIFLDLGGVYLSTNLLWRLRYLPQLEIALTPWQNLQGQRFRFRGGEGIIMPLRHEPDRIEYVPFDLFAPPQDGAAVAVAPAEASTPSHPPTPTHTEIPR